MLLMVGLRKRKFKRFVSTCTVEAMFIYPIKACAPIPINEAEMDERGIKMDRRFMITDADGNFLTQRTYPTLSLVKVQFEGNNDIMRLTAPGQCDLVVEKWKQSSIQEREVRVWKSHVRAGDVGDDAGRWISTFLKLEGLRLVFQLDFPDGDRRTTRAPDHQVSFADAYPILLTSTTSLFELNSHIPTGPVPMARFRPNLVVSGLFPWSEDWFPTFTWMDEDGKYGELKTIKPCDRCRVTTVIPERGEYSKDGEPFETLKVYRTMGYFNCTDVFFGSNLLIIHRAKLKKGQVLNVSWGVG